MKPLLKLAREELLELLQDGGGLSEVTIKASSAADWQRVLMDAHAELTRQLCYYMEKGNGRKVKLALKNIEDLCAAWRKWGPME